MRNVNNGRNPSEEQHIEMHFTNIYNTNTIPMI